MQRNLQKMFFLSKVIAAKLVEGISLNYNKNTFDRPSTCNKTVIRFQN